MFVFRRVSGLGGRQGVEPRGGGQRGELWRWSSGNGYHEFPLSPVLPVCGDDFSVINELQGCMVRSIRH